MRSFCSLLLFALVATGAVSKPAPDAGKPRVIIVTDPIEINANYEIIDEDVDPAHPETGDPDDMQSFVRFLVYANEFQIEGLIAGSERIDDGQSVVWLNRDYSLYRMLDKYDEVDENLRRHDPAFPTADHLRSKVRKGYSARDGRPGIPGPGKENPGSDLIIQVVDASPGPVWVLDWVGQPQQFELSQALWQVSQSRTPAELAAFVAKIRANYVIVARQPGTPGHWLEENFPELFLMGSRSTSVRAFRGLSDNDLEGADSSLWDTDWIERHVRNNHGALGAMLPTHTNPNDPGLQDYDSVTFLHLIPNGLSDIEDPSMGNWGGRFQRVDGTNRWLPAGDDHPTSSEPAQSIYWAIGRHHRAMQNDFAARMDWCVAAYPNANHNPVVYLNGHGGKRPVRITASPGTTVALSAAGSKDPDGDALQYTWWRYHEADSYDGAIHIENPTGREAKFVVPQAQNGRDIHIVLEVTDDGEPALTSYRRLIVTLDDGGGGSSKAGLRR
jgi:hypothetical protein